MSDDLKLLAIRKRIESDLLSADFQFSLMTAAALSYRHHTVLRPFPPMYASQADVNTVHDGISNDNRIPENSNYAQMVNLIFYTFYPSRDS